MIKINVIYGVKKIESEKKNVEGDLRFNFLWSFLWIKSVVAIVVRIDAAVKNFRIDAAVN